MVVLLWHQARAGQGLRPRLTPALDSTFWSYMCTELRTSPIAILLNERYTIVMYHMVQLLNTGTLYF
jgi:hypothetical protein